MAGIGSVKTQRNSKKTVLQRKSDGFFRSEEKMVRYFKTRGMAVVRSQGKRNRVERNKIKRISTNILRINTNHE